MPNLLLRYLLCNRNLAAMGAAGVITALYVAGLIDKWWWAIAAAAYVAVWLLPLDPRPKDVPPVSADLSTQQALDWLHEVAMQKLPASARNILGDILEQVKDILPRLKEMEGTGLVEVENRAAIKQTVKGFLPSAIGAYLRLPPLYARTAKVANGQTPEDVLVAQLRTLQTQVHAIQENILSSDVDALVAQSQFLKEKFSQPQSVLGDPGH